LIVDETPVFINLAIESEDEKKEVKVDESGVKKLHGIISFKSRKF
jgi:hypothetical protein